MEINEKQATVCGYLVGTILYLTKCPDIDKPTLSDSLNESLYNSVDKLDLTVDEVANLEELQTEILEFIRKTK